MIPLYYCKKELEENEHGEEELGDGRKHDAAANYLHGGRVMFRC
jgi:hypothetical protein